MSSSVSFTETMHGYLEPLNESYSADDLQIFRQSAKTQEQANPEENFVFVLKVECPDVEKFISDKNHPGSISGSVETSIITGKPQKFPVSGLFNLFIDDRNIEDNIEKLMTYTLWIKVDGKDYTFFGFKVVHKGQLDDAWEETTTLYSAIVAGHHTPDLNLPETWSNLPMLARGVLRLTPSDFAKQMSTFSATGDNVIEKLDAMWDFGKFFMGSLWESYKSFFIGSGGVDGPSFPHNRTCGFPASGCSTPSLLSRENRKLIDCVFQFWSKEREMA